MFRLQFSFYGVVQMRLIDLNFGKKNSMFFFIFKRMKNFPRFFLKIIIPPVFCYVKYSVIPFAFRKVLSRPKSMLQFNLDWFLRRIKSFLCFSTLSFLFFLFFFTLMNLSGLKHFLMQSNQGLKFFVC